MAVRYPFFPEAWLTFRFHNPFVICGPVGTLCIYQIFFSYLILFSLGWRSSHKLSHAPPPLVFIQNSIIHCRDICRTFFYERDLFLIYGARRLRIICSLKRWKVGMTLTHRWLPQIQPKMVGIPVSPPTLSTWVTCAACFQCGLAVIVVYLSSVFSNSF